MNAPEARCTRCHRWFGRGVKRVRTVSRWDLDVCTDCAKAMSGRELAAMVATGGLRRGD